MRHSIFMRVDCGLDDSALYFIHAANDLHHAQERDADKSEHDSTRVERD
jgi:hypothetical protein